MRSRHLENIYKILTSCEHSRKGQEIIQVSNLNHTFHMLPNCWRYFSLDQSVQPAKWRNDCNNSTSSDLFPQNQWVSSCDPARHPMINTLPDNCKREWLTRRMRSLPPRWVVFWLVNKLPLAEQHVSQISSQEDEPKQAHKKSHCKNILQKHIFKCHEYCVTTHC